MPLKTEDLQFLKDLQTELTTQETDGQAAPRFWTITDYKMVPCHDGDEDDYYVRSNKIEHYESLEGLLQAISESFDDSEQYAEEALIQFEDISDEIEATEWLCEHYEQSIELVPVKETVTIIPNTLFLTKAEARAHIENNSHHYSDRAHTYAMTAWRAPKVSRLIDILETIDWEQIPVDDSTNNTN